MPLVFLDTPQIDLLEKTHQNDPDRYRSFQTKWSARGCSLVFTSTQRSSDDLLNALIHIVEDNVVRRRNGKKRPKK